MGRSSAYGDLIVRLGRDWPWIRAPRSRLASRVQPEAELDELGLALAKANLDLCGVYVEPSFLETRAIWPHLRSMHLQSAGFLAEVLPRGGARPLQRLTRGRYRGWFQAYVDESVWRAALREQLCMSIQVAIDQSGRGPDREKYAADLDRRL